ncbi:hypothetical protein LCGC14_3162390, partial [marine sediment metagenome]
MASGILITAVLIFAMRGMFLGFSGVIGRLVGFGLGYYVAYSYRSQLAEFISNNTQISLPAIVIQMMSGLVLFMATLFVSGLLINALFKMIGKIIPGFKAIMDKESLGGKITGATV